MNAYYVGFDIRVNNLLSDHVLYGETPLDAAKRAYPGANVTRVKWEDARNADLIIQNCTVKDGKIYRQYGGKTFCYHVRYN